VSCADEVEQGSGDIDRSKQSGAAKSRNCDALNSKWDGEGDLGFNPIAITHIPSVPRLGLTDRAFKAMGWLSVVVGLLRPCAIEAGYKPWPITEAWAGPSWASTRMAWANFTLLFFSNFIFLLFFF
jgi:hypothetical protein